MSRTAWLQAAVLGVALSLSLALLVTARELMGNPGGIFRGAEGWRWDLLLETALSWFLPGLLLTVPLAALLLVATRWWRARRA